MWRFLAAGTIAAAASACLGQAVRSFSVRRRILIDLPNQRSSHSVPRPRSGGLAVAGGLAIGILAAAVLGLRLGVEGRVVLLGALAFGAVGLWDDLRHLPVWPRLAVEVVIAAWVVHQAGAVPRLPLPAPFDLALSSGSWILSIVWLVGVANFFNFMDGIDGLAVGQAAVVSIGALLAGWSSDALLLASLVLGAAAGFLPYNWSPSRVFLGDAGSLLLGFLLAGLPLLAPVPRRSDALLATAVALALFLLDPIETLLRRWRRGARIGESHREHRYQQLARPDTPHGRVSTLLVACGLGLSALGAASYRYSFLGWLAIGCSIAAFVLERQIALRASARQRRERTVSA